MSQDHDKDRVGGSQIPDSANNKDNDQEININFDDATLISDNGEIITYSEPIIGDFIACTYGPPHWEEEEMANIEIDNEPVAIFYDDDQIDLFDAPVYGSPYPEYQYFANDDEFDFPDPAEQQSDIERPSDDGR